MRPLQGSLKNPLFNVLEFLQIVDNREFPGMKVLHFCWKYDTFF
jgi:hypothetical protein